MNERIPKNPLMRYLILDECFRNQVGNYKMPDLMRIVNERLRKHGHTPVSERTLYKDIEFMKSDEGWKIKLADLRDGKDRIYTYKDHDFSILNMPLTREQRDQLGRTIQMLSHLKGLPNYRWLDQTLVLLREKFELEPTTKGCVSFASNEQLVGLEHFTPLYDALRRRQVLAITYHRFGNKSRVRVVHPYQLRQYNYRWYLIGYEERLGERHKYAVLALDRMEKIEVLKKEKFIKASITEVERYYENIIGVSRLPEGKVDAVRVKAYYPAAHYLETKPMHPTQRITEVGPDYKVFQWAVMENEELVQQLIVYADQLEIIRGDWVRNKLLERARQILEKNS